MCFVHKWILTRKKVFWYEYKCLFGFELNCLFLIFRFSTALCYFECIICCMWPTLKGNFSGTFMNTLYVNFNIVLCVTIFFFFFFCPCRCGWVCSRNSCVSQVQEMHQHLWKLHLQVPRRVWPAIYQWEIPVHRYSLKATAVGLLHRKLTKVIDVLEMFWRIHKFFFLTQVFFFHPLRRLKCGKKKKRNVCVAGVVCIGDGTWF